MPSAMTTVSGSAIALQARREVRRLADDAALLRLSGADQVADHDEPGRDADAHAASGAPATVFSFGAASTSASPARTARSASCSCACG